MNRANKKINIVLLSITVLTIGWVFFLDFTEILFLNISDFLSLALLVFGFRITFMGSNKGQYILLTLLLLSLVYVFKFRINISTTEGYSSNTAVNIGFVQFNPFSFFLLVSFLLLNRSSLIMMFTRVFYSSEKEREDKKCKEVDFYYNQFNSLNEDDFDKAFADFNDYPQEAQIALRKIEARRS